jgi:hypothetical protein
MANDEKEALLKNKLSKFLPSTLKDTFAMQDSNSKHRRTHLIKPTRKAKTSQVVIM